MHVTISAIKADIGGYVGHGEMHADVLVEAQQHLDQAMLGGLILDRRATPRSSTCWASRAARRTGARWEDNSHESTLFPGPDAFIEYFEHASTRRRKVLS